jgi:uncharacterized protein (DUF433 family)
MMPTRRIPVEVVVGWIDEGMVLVEAQMWQAAL